MSQLSGNQGDGSRFGGAFMQVINIKAFTDPDDYQSGVRAFLDNMKTTEPADDADEVLVPGDFERRNRTDRLQNGVEIPDTIKTRLLESAEHLEVAKGEDIVEEADKTHYMK